MEWALHADLQQLQVIAKAANQRKLHMRLEVQEALLRRALHCKVGGTGRCGQHWLEGSSGLLCGIPVGAGLRCLSALYASVMLANLPGCILAHAICMLVGNRTAVLVAALSGLVQ